MTEPGNVDVLAGGLLTQLEGEKRHAGGEVDITGLLLSEAGREKIRHRYQTMVEAGATVIAAPTFRCQRSRLAARGLHGSAGLAWPVHAAVGTALAVRRSNRQVSLVGTMWPVEDCYRPDLAPNNCELEGEYRWLATELVRAGVDQILVETMSSSREAVAAVTSVAAAGARAWAVSFVCDSTASLLSGEPVAEAATRVRDAGVETVAVNCTSLSGTTRALDALASVDGLTLGAYPNVERRSTNRDEDVTPEGFAAYIQQWREAYPLRVVGACCGATPAHVRAAAVVVGRRA